MEQWEDCSALGHSQGLALMGVKIYFFTWLRSVVTSSACTHYLLRRILSGSKINRVSEHSRRFLHGKWTNSISPVLSITLNVFLLPIDVLIRSLGIHEQPHVVSLFDIFESIVSVPWLNNRARATEGNYWSLVLNSTTASTLATVHQPR